MPTPCPTCGRCEVTREEIVDVINKDVFKALKHNSYETLVGYSEYGISRLATAILQRLRGEK